MELKEVLIGWGLWDKLAPITAVNEDGSYKVTGTGADTVTVVTEEGKADAGLALQLTEEDSTGTYTGAVGGDLAVNTGLSGSITMKHHSNGTEEEFLAASEGPTDIVRNGDITNTIDGVSVTGGVGGSAAEALGNMTAGGEYRDNASENFWPDNYYLKVNLTLNGETSTTVNGNVSTAVTGNAQVIGWTNGGLALGIGGTAVSTVNGDTVLTINGTDRRVPLDGENTDAVVSAVGVIGGGTAVTAIGGTAAANVNGTSHIIIHNADAVGVIGGGLAAAVDIADKDGKLNGALNKIWGLTENGKEGIPEETESIIGTSNQDGINITVTDSGKTGIAAAETEGTDVVVSGESNVSGILGGGMALGSNAQVSTKGTASITVDSEAEVNADYGTLVSQLVSERKDASGIDMSSYVTALQNAAGNAAIAAGGAAIGDGASSYVQDAVVNIAGNVNGDIYGGGIAAGSNAEETSEGSGITAISQVDTSTINLIGGTVTGNVYAGGAASGTAAATVDTSVINWGGTDVTGILSGQHEVKPEMLDDEDIQPADKTSTLNIIGNHTLSTVKSGEGNDATESSKIQGFDNVNFEAGSETILTGLTKDGSTALIDGGKVTVEDGARLNVEAIDSTTGTYKIAANTSEGSTFWDNDHLVYDRMGGYYVTGTGETDGSSYDVNVEEVTADNADAAAGSMANALGMKDLRSLFREGMMDGWKNVGEGAKSYFEEWQLAPELNAQYGRGVLLGEDAAVTGNTVSIARAMADNVTQRLSFTDDYVQEQGSAMQDGGVWAKYMHRKYETDGMSSSAGDIHSSTDYDGILVGVDFAKKGNFQSGVAIHYGSGDGDGLISHNDYDAWGITLYGSLKDEEAGTNLMADIGWMTSDNDIDGTVGSQRLTANRDVDAWTVGVRGEKEFVSGRNQIVPYAGLRYMSVNPGSYTTYYNGKAAFENDADNQNLWLLPVGVSFRNETVTAGGWKITPKLDVSYIWAFGDTDTDMTVNAGSCGGTLYYDVTDDSSWLASLGVEAEKDAWTFGVSYGYQKGDDTKNKTWYVSAGFSF